MTVSLPLVHETYSYPFYLTSGKALCMNAGIINIALMLVVFVDGKAK